MQLESEFGLRENLATIFRHRRKILMVFFMSIFVALAGSYLMSKVYQAQARVLVQINREPLRMSPALGPASGAALVSPRDEIITEIEIFKSPHIIERLVDQLGADAINTNMRWRLDPLREFPGKVRAWMLEMVWSVPEIQVFLEGYGLRYEADVGDPEIEAAFRIAGHLDVLPVPKASVFEVVFEAPRPDFAALVVNTMMDLYLEHHLEVRRPSDATEFYLAEAQKLRDQLKVAEEQLQAFKLDTGIFSVDDQIRLLLERLDQLETERADAHLQAVSTEELIAGIRQQLDEQDSNVQISQVRSRSPVAEELQMTIMSLELERARYAVDSPAALRLEQEIAEARIRYRSASGRVVASETSGVSQAYQDSTSRLINLEGNQRAHVATLRLIDAELNILREELRRLDQQAVTLRGMNLDVALKEEALTLYLRRTEETRIDTLLDERKVSNVRPIELASTPILPVRPRKFVNLLLGVFAGAIGGLGLAYLSEFLRRTLTTREEAEQALAQPVLASVLFERGRSRGRRENIMEFRRLAENIARIWRQQGVCKVLLSSALRREGKSFVSQKLAGAVAHQGNNVLLVDADFHRDDAGPGGRETKSSDSETQPPGLPPAVTPTDRPNVDALDVSCLRGQACGVHDFYRRVAQAIDRCSASYQLILIEAGSLDSDPEQLLVASKIGSVMLVVEADRTPAVTARGGLAQLEETGAKIVGVVLNKRRLIIPAWIYRWFLSPKRIMANAV